MSLDFAFGVEERAFREQVRQFLDTKLPEHLRIATRLNSATFVSKEIAQEWHSILHRQGWLGYLWPVEYGGTGWSPIQRFIFERECALADAPALIPMGLRYVGPVIFTFGSPQQKEYFLPRILNGEHYWAQGFSEPGAGSDLAALQCRADNKGTHYLVNGSKIWTTHAHFANWIFCILRTSKSAKSQDGVSFILINMQSPGIRIEPIITLGGDHDVNQVFFDDVKVPIENLVGEEGRGWQYAKFLLEYERGGVSVSGKIRRDIEHLVNFANRLTNDRIFNHNLTRLKIRVLALEATELRVMSQMKPGRPPGKESSILKLVSAQLEQDVSKLAVDAIGNKALRLFEHDTTQTKATPIDFTMPLMSRYLNLRASSIYGGSNEIQRNIIASHVLGLR
ncbi:Acyl-CoA dehydrogenase [Georgfuchsia toluolica]|uniref:Acyl-CoA dehydrogenase n=1 Tax=Georgfuchsia toluolica TaxID=424218 RepID=A0A916J6F4_9PROT|nr:acyl-CoA dehydrogenase family protein [Georgfuchsia toluolica]CAG4884795.1 Acyl-CoA dehydrogenase [Georgfuchsia toluolica]